MTIDDSKNRKNAALGNITFQPNKKYPTFHENLSNYFSEFCKKTGIHGLKYLGEQERSVAEKLYWLILLCISLYVCISLIVQTWVKWDQSPLVVSFAKSPAPVWQVPFPAITICPETKIKQTVYNFTDYYHKVVNEEDLSAEELQKFADSSLVCDNHLHTKGSKTTNLNTAEYLKSIGPQFSEVLFSCKWNSLNASCYNLFVPILTDDGICFTFNMLDKSELFTSQVYLHDDYMDAERSSEGWTIDDGYPKDALKDTFPRRATSAGPKAGMFLLLTAYEQDLDYLCRGPVQGFKVLLHHPAEVPRIGTQYFRAPLNQEIIVSVKPDVVSTSLSLRDYDPHRRQCFFSQERQLQFFRNYTQQNCRSECLAGYILARCGCVAYHMPHEESTNICGSGSNVCLFEAEQDFRNEEVESEFSTSRSDCDCLPSCTTITYNVETSQADFNWPKVFQAFKSDISELPGIQMTRLTIFFKDMNFIPSERHELYAPANFLAHCGGLLGLFTGISLLSIVEIIYFLSLRLVCNILKYGKKFWSGPKDSLDDDDTYL